MTDNSKEGREVSKDAAPGLPVAGGTIFGNSPVRRAPIARHPARSDATEEGNLRDQNATVPTSG